MRQNKVEKIKAEQKITFSYRIKILKHIMPYITGMKKDIALMFLYKLAVIPTALVIPVLYKLFVDNVLIGQKFSMLAAIFAGYIGVFVLQLLFAALEKNTANKVKNRFRISISSSLWKKYLGMKISFYDKCGPGDIKMTLDDDMNTVSSVIEKHIVDYIVSILFTAAFVISVFTVNWKMALVSLLLIPITLFIGFLISKYAKYVVELERTSHGAYNSWLYDILQKWKEVKSLGIENEQKDKFKTIWKRLNFIGILAILSNFLFWFIYELKNDLVSRILLYFIGAVFILNGEMTIGSLFLFMQYFEKLYIYLEKVNQSNIDIKSASPVLDRVTAALASTEIIQSGSLLKSPLTGNIAVHGVSFSYREDLGHAVEGISLSVSPGEHVAIVGKSGCGKSTLVKLMLNLYEPGNGQILYDGLPPSAYNPVHFHRNVAAVMQDSLLFNITIGENLRIAKPDATQEDLKNACCKAEILDFITSLPEGFDTLIGERGVKLSGGQKQRLAIARAILAKPRILIFDEATSSLDNDLEMRIRDVIDNEFKGITIINIAHRFATIRNADRVVVMEKGRIAGVGSHESLLENCPEYDVLFKEQYNIA